MKKNNGVALVLVLLVVSILVVAVLEFNYTSRVNAAVSHARHGRLQAACLARGGVNFARALLEADDRNIMLDTWADIPPVFTGNGSFRIEIIDEERFVNVNNLLSKNEKIREGTQRVLSNLLALSGVEPGLLADLYERLPLQTKDGLPEYLTVFPQEGRININTAPQVVLQSLSEEISEDMAEAIIDYRSKVPFRSIAQLMPIVGRDVFARIKDTITVRSTTFTIVSIGRAGRYRQEIIAVVSRRRAAEKSSVKYWKMM